MNEDQVHGAAEREMDLCRDEIDRVTGQRNLCSDTADRLRGQLRAVKVIADQHALGDTPRADLCRAVLDQITEEDL